MKFRIFPPISRPFLALLLASSLPLSSASAFVDNESFVHVPVARPAPTSGLDQRLVPSLNAPRAGLITVTPAAALGVLPGGSGGSESGCTIGTEGVAMSLAHGACSGVANFPKVSDLLN
jgi:hypothetical protein